jgi:hypothetical protein
MNDRTTKIIGVLTFSMVTFVLGSCLGASSVQDTWRLDAAATECAQFNPSNGHFEWITNENQ